MKDVANIDDLRKLAKKRLPRICYDYIEGGADDEVGLVTNELAFSRTRILPRYLVDAGGSDQSTVLFGRRYSSPVGIAPTGLAGLFRHGADMMLAQAARHADVPFILSGFSNSSIEQLGRVAPDHGWYQIYSSKNPSISEDMVRRAGEARLSTLVVTVDIPKKANRERDIRNGFGVSTKQSLSSKLEALCHPAWMVEWLRYGMPSFPDWSLYAPRNASSEEAVDFISTQPFGPITWREVQTFRELWKGNLVLKGIMHPEDAIRASSVGVDGIIVSNHGARQLDLAPSPLEVLPAICDAVGNRLTVMFDGGVRRGSHVLIALCLGAKFVFQGRPTLYGVTAGGVVGATKALAVFRREIDLSMAQIGAKTIADLGTHFLASSRGNCNAYGSSP